MILKRLICSHPLQREGLRYNHPLIMDGLSTCAEYGAVLGGESPLHTVETGSASLSKGVHREVESEES